MNTFPNQIKKVYDYYANKNVLPNALNPEFIRLLIERDYDKSSDFLGQFIKTYNDGINSWDLDGNLYENQIVDDEISTFDAYKEIIRAIMKQSEETK